jgi:hypothetical protein
VIDTNGLRFRAKDTPKMQGVAKKMEESALSGQQDT